MTTKTIVVLAVARRARRLRHHRALEADYGNSVASLIKAQAANPATLTSPSAAAVTGVDPDYANNVVNEFRKDVSKPENVKEPIEMAVIRPAEEVGSHAHGRRQQRGIVAVLVAVGLLALLVMVGLAIDIGHLVLNKSRLQSTVDAAALAAAKVLDQSGSEPQATVVARSVFDLNAAKQPELSRVLSGAAITVQYSSTLNPVHARYHASRLRAGASRQLLHVDEFHGAAGVR